MDDRKNLLRPLDSLDPPDEWRRAVERVPMVEPEIPEPHRSRASRIGTGIVALLLFAGAVGVAWRAFMEPKVRLPQATPSAVELITVTKPMDLPLSVSYPTDWTSRLISQSSLMPNGPAGPPGPPISLIGIVIANTSSVIADEAAPTPSPQVLPAIADLPSDSVVVRILAVKNGPPESSAPDSALPLSLDSARTRNGGELKELDLRIEGVHLTVLVSFGADATAQDMASAGDVVSSIADA